MTKDQAASPAIETVIAELRAHADWLMVVDERAAWETVQAAIAALASQQACQKALADLLAHCAQRGWWLEYHAVQVMDQARAALTRASSQEEPGAATPAASVEKRMEALGRAGFVVSVACGPCGARSFAWSVTVLSPAGDEFEEPFEAKDLSHAIAIAELEIQERGWLETLPAERTD